MAVVYKYVGKTRAGVSQAGEVTAATKEEAAVLLRRQNIVATSIKPKSSGLSMDIKIPGLGGKVKDKDIVVFTRQFATMIDAGLPIVQCLDILTKQTENKSLGTVIGKVREDLESGMTLTDAMKKHPKVFDDLYTNMVAAGETGGILDTILNRLAIYIEKSMKLKRKIKGAMIYPAVVVFVAVAVVAILMVYVVPVLGGMFTEMGGTLPLPTRLVLNMSNFMSSWWGGGLILLGLVSIIVAFWLFHRTEKGKRAIDGLSLRLPVFGILLRKYTVARFSRTLGTLISSGVPILDGLQITARTAGNKVVEGAVMETRVRVSEGKTLAEPLEQSKVFPPMVTQMIAVGEATGALENMLGKIADFYEEEVDNAVANLTALLEPILILFLGGVVGFIVVAMYMPIFKMGELIK